MEQHILLLLIKGNNKFLTQQCFIKCECTGILAIIYVEQLKGWDSVKLAFSKISFITFKSTYSAGANVPYTSKSGTEC